MVGSALPPEYEDFLADLKGRILASQIRAISAVNSELGMLYWQIGRGILQRQQSGGWGAKAIDRHSADLRHAFPEMKGFSARNLTYMRAFASARPDEEFVQGVLAQITW